MLVFPLSLLATAIKHHATYSLKMFKSLQTSGTQFATIHQIQYYLFLAEGVYKMVLHFLKEPGAWYRQKKLMFVILLVATFGAKKLFKEGWGAELELVGR
jgi:hypothetical protein